MAAGSGGGKRAWAVDLGKTLSEADASVELSRWQRHCIYRVPACIKDLNPRAYKPQVVSLGPFHHGNKELLPMEEHKRRAVGHLLRRANKPLEEFAAAVEEAAEQLESAYLDLDDRWRGAEGRERFLEMMIVDGCFVLEVIRAATGRSVLDYASNDPIFSRHGVVYMVPFIRRDMLMLENQLPLLLLAKLVAVETGKAPDDNVINRMVLTFLSPTPHYLPVGLGLGLHPLELYRRGMIYGAYQTPPRYDDAVPETGIIIMSSAEKLYEAGIRFKKSTTNSLHNVRFSHGVLSLPEMVVDDSVEYTFQNMVAFERLHAGAGNDVAAYLFFINNVIRSTKDVARLSSMGVIQNAIGSDEAVANMLNSISKDVVLDPDYPLHGIERQVNAYCRKWWSMWRAKLLHNYFRSPASSINFLAASIVVAMIVVQTIYTIVAFYKGRT